MALVFGDEFLLQFALAVHIQQLHLHLIDFQYTVDSPSNGHFGAQVYLGYVLYWGVLIKAPPTQPQQYIVILSISYTMLLQSI